MMLPPLIFEPSPASLLPVLPHFFLPFLTFPPRLPPPLIQSLCTLSAYTEHLTNAWGDAWGSVALTKISPSLISLSGESWPVHVPALGTTPQCPGGGRTGLEGCCACARAPSQDFPGCLQVCGDKCVATWAEHEKQQVGVGCKVSTP